MKKLALLLVLISLPFSVFSQLQTQFSHYSVPEGLTEINVICMLQDKKGQMWFGTFDGLNKFNGYSFKNYKTNPGELYGLVNYRIDRIQEDLQGNLWLQTYDRRIYRFDTRTEHFLQIPDFQEGYKNYEIPINNCFTLKDGSVWLTTYLDGCFQVDPGNEKVKISHYNLVNGLLSSNKVNKVYLDKDSNTWILTSKGLNILHPKNPKPLSFFAKKDTCEFLSILEEDSKIWFGGSRGTLKYYDRKKKNFSSISTPIKSKILAIQKISALELFLLTDKSGFYIYHLDSHQFTAYNRSNPSSGVISDNFFSCYMDKRKNLWLETDKPSVVYFESKQKKVNNFEISPDNALSYNVLPFIVLEDAQDNIWIHPRIGGFCKYNRLQNKLEYFYDMPHSKSKQFSNIMLSAFSDRQGNLWLCPYSHGIEKVTFRRTPFDFLKPDPDNSEPFNNEIRSIYQDKDNWLWAGSKNGILYFYDENRKFIGRLGADGRINSKKSFQASIYGITSDYSGGIWMASKGKGLFRVLKKGKGLNATFSITNYQYDPKDVYSLSSNSVYSVFEDHLKRIWVATYGGGLNRIDYINGKARFISFRNDLKNYPIKRSSRVRFITEDKKGRMFVGTTEGLIAFTCDNTAPQDIKFYKYTHHPEDPTSISGNDVHSILPSGSGRLYLAIFGGGLVELEDNFDFHKKPKFKSYLKNSGIPSNIILTLEEDRKGDIWLSTQTGIVKFSVKEQSFDMYNPIHSVDYSFMEAAVCKTKVGELVYGSTEGIFIFNPLKAKKSKYVPRVVFTTLQLFNKTMEVGVGDSPLKQILDETERIVLTHKQDIFSIGFAALDYADPQSVEYAYKLEGFENEWNYVGNHRFATYTNLPKGDYIFHVKSTNADKVWVENDRTIHISILPSFWNSSWGIFLMFVLFLALIVLIVFTLFTFYRLKNEVEVERRITNVKLRFFTDVSHELRTPLTLIASPVEHILRNEKINDTVKGQLVLVKRNTDRMIRLINQILDFRKIQDKKMKLLIEEISVYNYVKDICQSFNSLAVERNVIFECSNLGKDARLWVDKDKFEKILYNLLSNAFKFTLPGNRVEVILTENSETVSITVKDQGMGISKDRLKLIFNRFESMTMTTVSFQQGTGIGLSLTKELLEMHRATIEVVSEPGKGSSFKVTFLKGFQHFPDIQDFLLSDPERMDKSLSVSPIVEESSENPGEKQVILVSEDNAELRSFLKSVLSRQYHVLEAENGLVALQMAKEHIPDLILSDVRMPEMDGIELSRVIKEDISISHIPLVLLTAKTDLESKLEALKYGADDYITKPFSSAYLEARVENLLKKRKQLQELYRSSISSGVFSISNPEIVSQDDLFIQGILNYMEDNMDNTELVIEDIVANMGFSRSAFFKKLKSLTGMAPVEFLKEIRLQRAAQLVLSGDYNISQITFMVGMEDPKYFSRCFKLKFGLSPKEYKEKSNIKR